MELPKMGQKVRTNATLGDTIGFMIAPHHISARRPSADGTYQGFVPGHGGDVWWVNHGPGDVAAYAYTELAIPGEGQAAEETCEQEGEATAAARAITAASVALSRFGEEWSRLPESVRLRIAGGDSGIRDTYQKDVAARLVRTGILLGEAILQLQAHGLAPDLVEKARPYGRFILGDHEAQALS